MWESIGECDGSVYGDELSWVAFCNEFALNYLRTVMGEPSKGATLEIKWNDHELGSYPTIGVTFSSAMDNPPWDYINKAEQLLDRFNDSVKWSDLKDAMYEEDEDS